VGKHSIAIRIWQSGIFLVPNKLLLGTLQSEFSYSLWSGDSDDAYPNVAGQDLFLLIKCYPLHEVEYLANLYLRVGYFC
jgi:hypothetical protein